MGINRRSFVKGAGLASLTGVGMAAHALAEEVPAQESWMPEKWDAEADAVIVGYGCAGPVAAIDLAKRGLTSLLIEKTDRENAGGNCSVSGGYVMQCPDKAQPNTAEGVVTSAAGTVSNEYAQAILPYINEAPEYLMGWGVRGRER